MTLNEAFDNEMGHGGKTLVRRLAEAGFAAYFVGGCVRDALLGRPIKDIDIATSARPEDVMALFPQAVPTGLQHGTVTIPLDGFPYEVTTFRAESDYSDGRRPDAVRFIDDVEGDLERRDFTVNAMALASDGNLVDPFGGRADLERRLLRAVGSPAERFREDALRMLRCVRFAAEYGFDVDEPTWAEVRLGAPGLGAIAMERVFAELEKMIGGAAPERAIALLAESELLRWTKQRLRLPRSLGLDAPDDPLARLRQVPDPLARWAFWFACMDLDEGEARQACKALKTSNGFADAMERQIKLFAALRRAPDDFAREAWIVGALRHGADEARRFLALAAVYAEKPHYAWMRAYATEGAAWLRSMPVASLKELAVTGSDVLAVASGRKGGPWLSGLLDRLLTETALGKLPNERGALLERAAAWLEREQQSEGDESADER